MRKNSRFWFLVLALGLIAATAVACTAQLPALPAQLGGAAAAPTVEAKPASAAATIGDLTVTVNGTGSLAPNQELDLGFGAAGTVAGLSVQTGDQVTPGEELAALDDTTLRNQVVQAGIALRKAQLTLDTTIAPPTADQLAAAQSTLDTAKSDLATLVKPPSAPDVSAARENLASAQQALLTLAAGVSSDQKTASEADVKSAQVALQQAQSAYDQIAWRSDAGMTTQAATLQNATIAYEKAKAQYDINVAGPADSDVSAAQAKIASAQAALDTLTTGPNADELAAANAKVAAAQSALNQLVAGPSANTVELAQLAVQQARNDLQSSMAALQGAIIRAPITGTVTAVSVSKGQQAGTGTAVVLADQASAQVEFWLEELDAAQVKVGDGVSIVFDAFPGDTFTGKVTRIEPKLVTVDNAPAAQLWATIDMKEHPDNLLYGMSADVQVTAGEAHNAVLVPIQALRELAPGQFAVFVVQPDGELALRPVQVGLRDFVNAEIVSGLQGGEQVSTATASNGNRPQTQ
jgi:HlyD family secretion protein